MSVDGFDDVDSTTPDEEIELIIGITRAVGTPADAAMEQLKNSLSNYGYEVSTVKISDLLTDSARDADNWDDDLKESDRIARLIAEGNRLNLEAGVEDELVLRAITEIRDRRSTRLREASSSRKANASPDGPVAIAAGDEVKTETLDEKQRPVPARSDERRAYIIDSLKRPTEVASLRTTYGDHFILFGLQASAEVREGVLVSRFATDGATKSEARDEALKLIDQDNHERLDGMAGSGDAVISYGQDMLVTLPMSDVFVNVETTDSASREVRRAIELLFGDPEADGPTIAEVGLQLASQSAARSTELGLRVGAVIINASGDVISVGTNRHPVESTSPEFDAGALDIRQLVKTTLAGLAQGGVLDADQKKLFEADQNEFVRRLLKSELADSDLKGLTEYQRAVHAEMDALISASRQRADLYDATVYVTNYPCHGCAKHLIALGLKVVYLEPYAKGKAQSMYGDATSSFVPFTGVAPRRYEPWFVSGRAADRKDKSGRRIHWSPEEKSLATPIVTQEISMESKHRREGFATGRKSDASTTDARSETDSEDGGHGDAG